MLVPIAAMLSYRTEMGPAKYSAMAIPQYGYVVWYSACRDCIVKEKAFEAATDQSHAAARIG